MKKQKGENLLKIRVNVSKKRYKEVEEELRLAGFEIVDEAEFLLSECNQYAEYLSCKKQDSSYHVPVSEIYCYFRGWTYGRCDKNILLCF